MDIGNRRHIRLYRMFGQGGLLRRGFRPSVQQDKPMFIAIRILIPLPLPSLGGIMCIRPSFITNPLYTTSNRFFLDANLSINQPTNH